MKVKKISVKIESEADFWNFLKKEADEIDNGNFPKKTIRSVSFTNLNEVRKVLTPQRLRLIKTIKQTKPSSIYALARTLRRTFTNTYNDLQMLEQLGFLELTKEEKTRAPVKPSVDYGQIRIAISV